MKEGLTDGGGQQRFHWKRDGVNSRMEFGSYAAIKVKDQTRKCEWVTISIDDDGKVQEKGLSLPAHCVKPC